MSLGVVVGRFQVSRPHAGHMALVSHALLNHDRVVIVLGSHPMPVTKRDPLSVEQRAQMLYGYWPEVQVTYVRDQWDDAVWSANLDHALLGLLPSDGEVVIYGARDHSLDCYTGAHKVEILSLNFSLASGTTDRLHIQAHPRGTEDFRAGVIWAAAQSFPTSYQTVDIAAFSFVGSIGTSLLLGRKYGEPMWRLPGGFSDPESSSLEADAQRELLEETGLSVDQADLTYVFSTRIQDWRYAKLPHCIKTALFIVHTNSGVATSAGDDLEEVLWFPVSDIQARISEIVMPLHRGLVQTACRHVLQEEFE